MKGVGVAPGWRQWEGLLTDGSGRGSWVKAVGGAAE